MKTKAILTQTPRDSELEELRARLTEAEQTLQAMRQGEVDALVVSGAEGDQIFTLQGAEKPYRLLIEAMNEGAATVLQDGTVLYCNRRLAGMVNDSAEKVSGSNLFRFVRPEQQPALRRLLASAGPEGAKGEFTLVDQVNGQTALPVQLSVAPLAIDSVPALGLVVTDLSERKRQEEILRQLNVALEQRVTERTAQVSHAHEALQQAQAKLRLYAEELELQVVQRTAALQQSVDSLQQFCYTMAHDLRAPLRTINGFTTTLLEEFADRLPPQGQDFARRIAAGAARMDELIRDLLAYGRLNAAELPLQETDPAALLEHLLSLPDLKNAEVRVESPLPKVVAHPSTLEQILVNLLDNALKFVPPGVRPRVRIFAKELQTGWVRICVQDNGIGIEPRLHDRLFRVFERVCPKQYPGTGIGLAIVQKGVERMGGRVGVESAPGQGSCFWFELPKAVAPADAPANSAVAESPVPASA